MEAWSQEVNLLGYSCRSLAALADFWRSRLKSSPPGCCRPESKHYKEIKYECEKLARMALPLHWDLLHSRTHLTDRKSLWLFVESNGEACGKCYERELSHSTPMTKSYSFLFAPSSCCLLYQGVVGGITSCQFLAAAISHWSLMDKKTGFLTDFSLCTLLIGYSSSEYWYCSLERFTLLTAIRWEGH